MLCNFGQLRNGSVVTRSIHFNSTAASSATSECVTVPERNGQNEELASTNEERTRNTPSFGLKCFQTMRNEIICICLTCKHEFSLLFFYAAYVISKKNYLFSTVVFLFFPDQNCQLLFFKNNMQQGSEAVGLGFESLSCQLFLRFIPYVYRFPKLTKH